MNEWLKLRSGERGLNDRNWVTKNTNRDAPVAITVRVFVNHIVDSLLPISKQYFLEPWLASRHAFARNANSVSSSHIDTLKRR